jgi:exosortase
MSSMSTGANNRGGCRGDTEYGNRDRTNVDFRRSAAGVFAFQGIWITVLLLAAFAPTLRGIYGSWFDDQIDMAHGVFVVPIALFMVWSKRDVLRQTRMAPTAWGLLLVLCGAIQGILGTAAQWVWVSRTAFLISLAGCVLTLYGSAMIRELAYPLCILLLMIAPPTFLYERITLPLQLLASWLGEISLDVLGYSVLREGNIIELVGGRLAIEEACSGIRSLMALFFLCVVYCYFVVPQRALRAALFVAVVPISIICNAGRILATGVVGQYDRQLGYGLLHPAFGHVGLVLATLLALLMHRVLLKAYLVWHTRQA